MKCMFTSTTTIFCAYQNRRHRTALQMDSATFYWMHVSQSAEDVPAGSPGARSHVWIAACSPCIPQPLPRVTLLPTAKRHRGNKAECLHLCATQGGKRQRENKLDAPKDTAGSAPPDSAPSLHSSAPHGVSPLIPGIPTALLKPLEQCRANQSTVFLQITDCWIISSFVLHTQTQLLNYRSSCQ